MAITARTHDSSWAGPEPLRSFARKPDPHVGGEHTVMTTGPAASVPDRPPADSP